MLICDTQVMCDIRLRCTTQLYIYRHNTLPFLLASRRASLRCRWKGCDLVSLSKLVHSLGWQVFLELLVFWKLILVIPIEKDIIFGVPAHVWYEWALM